MSMESLKPKTSADNLLQNYRLETLKYRIYIGILLVLSYVMRTYVSAYSQEYQMVKDTRESSDATLQQLDSQITQANGDLSLVRLLSGNQAAFVNVLNSRTGCSQIPKPLQQNLPALKIFMQLSDLESTKMKVDEKRLLQNINEFLLDAWWGVKWGSIQSVTFGDPKFDKNKNPYVPITLKVTTDYRGLVGIVDAIETHISLENPLFYVIESIKYNIVNANQQQDVDIILDAYYYKN